MGMLAAGGVVYLPLIQRSEENEETSITTPTFTDLVPSSTSTPTVVVTPSSGEMVFVPLE